VLEFATQLTSVLGKIHQVLSNDEELAKMVKYRVQERGHNEKNRLARVLQFQGPDDDTIEVLRNNHQQWLQDPSMFWRRPSLLPVDPSDAQARIIAPFLQTIRDHA
jgi:hypothetical protein